MPPPSPSRLGLERGSRPLGGSRVACQRRAQVHLGRPKPRQPDGRPCVPLGLAKQSHHHGKLRARCLPSLGPAAADFRLAEVATSARRRPPNLCASLGAKTEPPARLCQGAGREITSEPCVSGRLNDNGGPALTSRPEASGRFRQKNNSGHKFDLLIRWIGRVALAQSGRRPGLRGRNNGAGRAE